MAIRQSVTFGVALAGLMAGLVPHQALAGASGPKPQAHAARDEDDDDDDRKPVHQTKAAPKAGDHDDDDDGDGDDGPGAPARSSSLPISSTMPARGSAPALAPRPMR